MDNEKWIEEKGYSKLITVKVTVEIRKKTHYTDVT